MKNEHIVQFLEAFPFNPSCNQLLDKLSSLENQKSSQQSIQSTGDLIVNPSIKLNYFYMLLDFCKRFHKKLLQLRNQNTKGNNAAIATLANANSNGDRQLTATPCSSGETNRNVHKIEIHLYDLLFLVQKIKLGLEISEDVYKFMTDEKSKTKMFVPLYFEIVTNNGECEAEVYRFIKLKQI